MKKTFNKIIYILFVFCGGFLLSLPLPANIQTANAASNDCKIHFLTLSDNTDAILLECNGRFGMVDSGEDNDSPSGSNPNYPLRPGIIQGNGFEDKVISYLYSVGVTKENFEFYIGTHPHSDHIGSADEIIYEFHPKRVYIEAYSDNDITDSAHLWDNLYVYDHMITAAQETGATLIQAFDTEAPLYPETVTIRGKILTDSSVSPSDINVTLNYTASDSVLPVPESQTVSAVLSDNGIWTYEFTNIRKYDDSKTPFTFDIEPASEGFSFTSFDEENSFDFLCSAPENAEDTEVSALTLEESSRILENSGITSGSADEPLSLQEGISSDNMKTGNISAEDQVDPNHPDDPNNAHAGSDSAPAQSGIYDGETVGSVSTPVFMLGGENGMQIEIMNYGVSRPQPDANYFSLGVKVTSVSSGKTAFLSGDINNYIGAETALSEILGHVDILKLGHHGYYGSNTPGYLRTLSPDIAIMTGKYNYVSNSSINGESGTLDSLLEMGTNGTPLYATSWYAPYINAIVINLDENLTTNIPSGKGFVASAQKVIPNRNIYYLDGFPSPTSGWKKSSNGSWFYFEDSYDASVEKWLKTPSGTWFYLKEDGSMATGWVQIDDKWYYFNKNGTMQTGWVQYNENWYYLNSSGTMMTGRQLIDKYYYYFDSETGIMITNQYVGGYFYGSSGKQISNWNDGKWVKDSRGWWYRLSDGSYPKNCWANIQNTWYYFNRSGYMTTGWLHLDNLWYYLSPDSGALKTGWYLAGGKWYYSNANGEMLTGWQKIGGKSYYLNESGSMRTGWFSSNGSWYYLGANGAMCTGWYKVNNIWYYSNASGSMLTGFQRIGNKTYYLKDNGAMQIGWLTKDNNWYYFSSDGAMAVGWYRVNNHWYFSDQDGKMLTGLQDIKNKIYYLASDGAMRTGWLMIDNDWYYFTENGAVSLGWYRLNNTWYYFKDSKMQTGWLNIGNKTYYLNQKGAMCTGWIFTDDNWYYMDSLGAMTTGWQQIKNSWYYLDSVDGHMHVSSWTPDGCYVNEKGIWTGLRR